MVIGTGAFATAFAKAFVRHDSTAAPVVVVGRSELRAAGLADELAAHGAATTRAVVADLGFAGNLPAVCAEVRPSVVVVCASPQSPYEAATAETAWTKLLRSLEFGFTGLLHAVVAAQAAETARGPVVNACYPDFVNPLLAAVGSPVLCGLGNVATLAAALHSGEDGGRLRLLAHHRHLKTLPGEEEDARLWWDGHPAPALRARLDRVRALPRRALNDLGAAHGGKLVAELVADRAVAANLPGVAGLPGGFPVVIDRNCARVNLPPTVDPAEAIAWQRRHAAAEGIAVTAAGAVRFHGNTRRALRKLGLVRDDQINAAEWPAVAEALLDLRSRLRRVA
jgi:hypothetical protein